MVRSTADKETERLFHRRQSRKIPPDVWKTALRKLGHVDAATTLNDLRVFPGNRLEALKGDREGQHGIRINDQWRICFVWKEGDAYEVEMCDYH